MVAAAERCARITPSGSTSAAAIVTIPVAYQTSPVRCFPMAMAARTSAIVKQPRKIAGNGSTLRLRLDRKTITQMQRAALTTAPAMASTRRTAITVVDVEFQKPIMLMDQARDQASSHVMILA